jgi:hypothetical protein
MQTRKCRLEMQFRKCRWQTGKCRLKKDYRKEFAACKRIEETCYRQKGTRLYIALKIYSKRVHEQFIIGLQFYDFNLHVTKNSTSECNFSFYHSMKLLINIRTIWVQPIILCMFTRSCTKCVRSIKRNIVCKKSTLN